MEIGKSFIFISVCCCCFFIGRADVGRFVLDWKERGRNLFLTGREVGKKEERKKVRGRKKGICS